MGSLENNLPATIHPGLWGNCPLKFAGGLAAVKIFGRKAASYVIISTRYILFFK
jgi:hypothetical protein